MRALIADDDRGTTAILKKTLERVGLVIDVAHDGNAAWQALRGVSDPALAVVDWEMPGLSGPELCRRIREEAALSHMYVILVTGRDSRHDVVAGLDAGADDYIVKPFDVDELSARVHVGLRVLKLQGQLAQRIDELQATRDELARLASTDVLTGLFSRRRWFELATIEFSRFCRYKRSLGLLIVDLDFFKRVNDTFGHDSGDRVLSQFAELLRSTSRQSDIVGRLGGEEFAVLLPETDQRAAEDVARRIVEGCHRVAIPEFVDRAGCSCSIGIAQAAPTDGSIEEVLRRADQAMYRAKREGRDCWRSSVGLPDTSANTPAMPEDTLEGQQAL
jgi:diguanylate cyclase (GGDEF)-like protein